MSNCSTFNHKPKIKHLNKPDAIKHAILRQKSTNIKVVVYRCNQCAYWHVGRRKTTKKEKRWQNKNERINEKIVGELIAALKNTLTKKMR